MNTIHDLQKLVADFNERRGWRKEHTPKALAVSVAIEAAEILQLFQWIPDSNSLDTEYWDTVKKQALCDEVADVFIYLLGLCDKCGLDPAQAINSKLKRNELRFPQKKL